MGPLPPQGVRGDRGSRIQHSRGIRVSEQHRARIIARQRGWSAGMQLRLKDAGDGSPFMVRHEAGRDAQSRGCSRGEEWMQRRGRAGTVK
jgi:hypothetical protein